MATMNRGIDTSVKLPAAVVAANARAEELLKGAQPGEEQVTDPVGEDVTSEVTNPPAPPEPAPAAAPVQADDNDKSWKDRYESMKGRYDKEMPRLRDQLVQLSEDMAAMRNALAAANSRPAEPAAKSSAKLVTDEEEAEYGADFMSIVARKAREEMEPILNELRQENANLKAQVNQVNGHVVENARTRMETELDEKVPTWRQINQEWEANGFKDWLLLPDAYSGVIRHELLNKAYEQNNSPRVLAFFQGFLNEAGLLSPADPKPAPAPSAPRLPLKDLAAPGRASAASPTTPAEKPIITNAQVKKFYDDCARGKYLGREPERLQMEREIFAATNEGRYAT